MSFGRATLAAVLVLGLVSSAAGQDSRQNGTEGDGCDSIVDGAIFGILPGILAGFVLGQVTEGAVVGKLTVGQLTLVSGGLGGLVGVWFDSESCNPPSNEWTEDTSPRARHVMSLPEGIVNGGNGQTFDFRNPFVEGHYVFPGRKDR